MTAAAAVKPHVERRHDYTLAGIPFRAWQEFRQEQENGSKLWSYGLFA